jgi:hypothetical protein
MSVFDEGDAAMKIAIVAVPQFVILALAVFRVHYLREEETKGAAQTTGKRHHNKHSRWRQSRKPGIDF